MCNKIKNFELVFKFERGWGLHLSNSLLYVEVPGFDPAEDGVDGGVGKEVDVEVVKVPDKAT